MLKSCQASLSVKIYFTVFKDGNNYKANCNLPEINNQASNSIGGLASGIRSAVESNGFQSVELMNIQDSTSVDLNLIQCSLLSWKRALSPSEQGELSKRIIGSYVEPIPLTHIDFTVTKWDHGRGLYYSLESRSEEWTGFYLEEAETIMKLAIKAHCRLREHRCDRFHFDFGHEKEKSPSTLEKSEIRFFYQEFGKRIK